MSYDMLFDYAELFISEREEGMGKRGVEVDHFPIYRWFGTSAGCPRATEGVLASTHGSAPVRRS